MKKVFLFCMLGSIALLTSCNQEETVQQSVSAADTREVTINVSVPESIATRSYSDGQTATYLSYAVFYNDGEDSAPKTLVTKVTRANVLAHLQTSLTLTLLRSYDYTVVFWADAAEASPYTLTFGDSTAEVSMNYEATNDGNNEGRDAFWNTCTITANQTDEVNVILHRPFAQLNWGADDLSSQTVTQAVTVAQTTFTVTIPANTLYNTFSLIDGTASDQVSTDVAFAQISVPTQSEIFPVTGYAYMSMNYLLVGSDTDSNNSVVCSSAVTLDVEDLVQGTALDQIAVSNMPLQRNYQTNIYGRLYTGDYKINVTVCPNYWGSYSYNFSDENTSEFSTETFNDDCDTTEE